MQGALIFRAVATPEGTTRTKLIGPFSGATQRYLLIGKYEITSGMGVCGPGWGTGVGLHFHVATLPDA